MSFLSQRFHLLWIFWQRRRLKLSEFDYLFDKTPIDEVVCFDCETTGLNPSKDKIISLSAIKIKGNQILTSQSLNLVVKQSVEVPAESIRIHQIRHYDLKAGLDEREAIRQFLGFIGSRPLVGYYLEFDVELVNQVLKPWLGIKLPNRQIEVSELYYDVRLNSIYSSPHYHEIDLSFSKILQTLELPNFGQHDAYHDALMTSLIFIKLQSIKKLKQN